MDPRAFGGKPPMDAPVTPSPMPAPAEGMACPHCAKPVMLQKHPMEDAQSKPAPKMGKPMKMDKKDAPKDKPAKAHNAATAPIDQLKEVLKSRKSNDGE